MCPSAVLERWEWDVSSVQKRKEVAIEQRRLMKIVMAKHELAMSGLELKIYSDKK